MPPVRGGYADIEPFQDAAWEALTGPATHILLPGGARSGKTYLIVKFMVIRALGAPEATQAILRFRFNHLKASIIFDTLPNVCKTEWPGPQFYTLNRSDWFAEFRNGHKIYFGGLDDKDRTEKILGQGHSTIYLNEASQISYNSRNKAVTRLSQNKGLRLKEVVDENPPFKGHWTERLWVHGVDPATGRPLSNPEDYDSCYMQPKDNPHIPDATKRILAALPPRDRVRFWEGRFSDAVEGALWTYESIEAARVDKPPQLDQVVVAVDPSGSHGPEDKRSDEVGIVVAGIDGDNRVHILEDASANLGPSGKDGWAAVAVMLYAKWKADRIVAETNFGGAMVGAVVKAQNPDVSFREVHAARGKAVRAEPVSTLFNNGKVKLVGHFPELEEQLLQFSTAGFGGSKSPDRADAMVWAVYDLALGDLDGVGLINWTRQQAEQSLNEASSLPAAQAVTDTVMVSMQVRPGLEGVISSRNGNIYVINSGLIDALPDDVQDLIAIGFKLAENQRQCRATRDINQ